MTFTGKDMLVALNPVAASGDVITWEYTPGTAGSIIKSKVTGAEITSGVNTVTNNVAVI